MSLSGHLYVDDSDDEIAFAFTVTNDGGEPVELKFSDAQSHDLVVVEDGDTEIWRYGDGQMFAQMLQTETLAPGESTTYDCRWSATEPGSYTATAFLEATNADCEASAEFSV